MILLLFSLCCTIAATSAGIIPLGVTVGIHPQSHAIQSLYHAQDVLGQYSYGYATPTSTKSETKTVDGVTRGGYSYIDTNGHLQTVEYVSDPVHGFRVAASNLPQDLPDVAYAKAKHLADFETIKASRAQLAAQVVKYSNPITVPVASVQPIPLAPLPEPVQDLPEVIKARNEHLAAVQVALASAGTIPQPIQDLPEVAKARAEHLAAVEATKLRDATWNSGIALSPIPQDLSGSVVPIHTPAATHGANIHVATAVTSYTPALAPSAQYHAQDGLGHYSYGYIEPLSAKTETRTPDGVTRGGYSYIDANGILQTVTYQADAVHGFRVAATNLLPPPHQSHVAVIAPEIYAKGAVVSAGSPVGVPQLYETKIVY